MITPIRTHDYFDFFKVHSFHFDIVEFQNQNGDVFLIFSLRYHVSSLALNISTSFSAVASFGLKIQHFELSKLTLGDTRTMAVWSKRSPSLEVSTEQGRYGGLHLTAQQQTTFFVTVAIYIQLGFENSANKMITTR